MMKLSTCVLALLTLTVFAAETKVYKTVDENGNVVFTDQPTSAGDGKQVEISTIILNTYSSADTPAAAAPFDDLDDPDIDPMNPYEALVVVSPDADEAIRDNAGNVYVEGRIDPALKAGHQAVVFLDGMETGHVSDELSFSLPNVDRGTHTVHIAVIDKDGQTVIESESTTFHLHRFALRKQPRPNPN